MIKLNSKPHTGDLELEMQKEKKKTIANHIQ